MTDRESLLFHGFRFSELFIGIFCFIAVTTVLLSLNMSPVYAATYYVAMDGDDDANPGTMDHPWRTIQKAASTLAAGDTVYVRAGTYTEHVQALNSGNSGAEITYSNHANETVTIDGTGLDLPEWSGLFDVSERQYIRVIGFRVINSGPTLHNPGIQADTSNHISILNNYTYNTSDSGIMLWNSTDCIVDGNEVEAACYYMYNECITVGMSNNVDVRNNHVHHSQKEGICVKDGSHDCRVYGNTVHDTAATGFYVDAQAVYTYNIEVFNNISYDGIEDGFTVASEVGGLLENVTLYNNIAYNNGWVGFDISDCCIETHPMNNIRLINNTSVANGIDWGGGVVVQNPQVQNVLIRNNIASQNLSFQIAVASSLPPGSVQTDHNLIDGFRAGEDEVYGDDYIEGNPMFINSAGGDFHIQPGSPAVDRGSEDGAPATDFDGQSRPAGQGIDIGVDECTQNPDDFSVILSMPSHFFTPGDNCSLIATLFSPENDSRNIPFVCILDILSEYWFAPGWSQDFEYGTELVAPGFQTIDIIPGFSWPDTGESTLDGIRFWAALTSGDFSEVLGGESGIAMWSFGFGP